MVKSVPGPGPGQVVGLVTQCKAMDDKGKHDPD